MSDAILTIGGTAVKTDTFYDYNISNEGTLHSFKTAADQEEYTYFSSSSLYNDFHLGVELNGMEDILGNISGYYQKSIFSSFYLGTIDIILLPDYSFNYWNYAEDGDMVEVRKLSPGYTGTAGVYNFNEYYRNIIYKFKKTSTGFLFYNRVSNFPAINTDISSPNYSEVFTEYLDYSTRHTGLFYKKNFGDHVNSWSIPDVIDDDDILNHTVEDNNEGKEQMSKYNLAYMMTLICWKMSHIKNNVLQTVAIENVDFIINCYRNRLLVDAGLASGPVAEDLASNYDGFTFIDKTIADLCRDWGLLSTGGSTIDFDPILPTVPDYDALNNYYNSLKAFHERLKDADEDEIFPVNELDQPVNEDGDVISDEQDSRRRLEYLTELLPSNALATLPVEARLEWLDHFMGITYITDWEAFFWRFGPLGGYVSSLVEARESDQRTAIQIILSFANTTDANDLVDFFLDPIGGKTKFEILYNKLDDARIERYPVVSWFVERQTNRMFFVYGLYEAWKLSKYNFYHIPAGTPTNSDGLDPNGFWLNEGADYYNKFDAGENLVGGNNAVLEFEHRGVSDGYLSREVGKGVLYEPIKELDGEKITINRVTYRDIIASGPGGMIKSRDKDDPELHGVYHLYQPIVLLGYQADLDLKIPNFSTIPAFLFYYAVDYDKIKDFDAALVFAIDVGLEIAFFFLSGGVSSVRHLRHLKHVTKLFKVKNAYGSMSASTKVLFWRGIDAGSTAIEVPASLMYSYFTYEASTEDNPALAELNRKLSYFFLGLTFVTIGGALTSKYRCVKSADEVLKEIDNLSDLGVPHGVPADVIDIMNTVKNTATVSKTLFRNNIITLTDVDLGEINRLGDIFEGVTAVDHVDGVDIFFNDAAREAFWRQFGQKAEVITDNLDFWSKMNRAEDSVDAARMKTWHNCIEELKFVRRDMEVLDSILEIKKSDELTIEIFKGRTGKKLKDGVVPPYNHTKYIWEAKGVHHIDAMTPPGNIARLKPGDPIEIHTRASGDYYKASVQIYNSDLAGFNINGGWKTKDKYRGFSSTFFPDSWSKQKVQEMISYAYANKRFIRGNTWKGEMLDGVEIVFHIDGDIIKTAYPNL